MKRIIRKILNKIFIKLRFILYKAVKLAEKEVEDKYIKEFIQLIPILGENLRINGKIVITHPRLISIGSNVHIGNNAYFNTAGGLVIGDNVHFSRNITIYTSSHNYEGGLPYDEKIQTKSVVIKKNAWVGMNVNITPGVTIGEGAIVGMGAVITRDVPDYSIVGNQPYREIKTRNINNYHNLLKEDKIGGINGNILSRESCKFLTGKELRGKLFFVISTGRSGSTSIANILDQHPNVICRHEISDILISLSTQFVHGEISLEKTKHILKEIYSDTKIFPPDMWFGESNQKLSALVPILKDILPEARFIWLIRDGMKVVDSTYARKWYFNDSTGDSSLRVPEMMIWNNYRLMGNKTGDFSNEAWERMSAFEKNCWYWVKWNSLIDAALNDIPKKQKLFVKLEELEGNLSAICEFLDLPNIYNFEFLFSNTATDKLKGTETWSTEEQLHFEHYCGEFYQKHY